MCYRERRRWYQMSADPGPEAWLTSTSKERANGLSRSSFIDHR
jgi:hypothetical protein